MADNNHKFVLVAYDTPSDRRRRKWARILQGFGFRVQYSVFQAWLSDQQIRRLSTLLSDLLEPTVDSIFIVPLNQYDLARIITLGQARVRQKQDYIII